MVTHPISSSSVPGPSFASLCSHSLCSLGLALAPWSHRLPHRRLSPDSTMPLSDYSSPCVGPPLLGFRRIPLFLSGAPNSWNVPLQGPSAGTIFWDSSHMRSDVEPTCQPPELVHLARQVRRAGSSRHTAFDSLGNNHDQCGAPGPLRSGIHVGGSNLVS